MSDIDFEELDKAVNSLMKPEEDTPRDESVSHDDVQSLSSTNDTASADDMASVSTDSVVSTENTTPLSDQQLEEDTSTSLAAAPAQPSLATKRRGKFMDVMHPGTAAAKNIASSQPTKSVKPSRQGVSLQPVGEASEEINTSGADGVKSAATTVGAEVSPVALSEGIATDDVSSVEADRDTLQDNLSIADVGATQNDNNFNTFNKATPAGGSFGEVDPLGIATEEPGAQPPASSLVDSAVASPFLSDAKVEKRPLGTVDQPSSSDELVSAELSNSNQQTEGSNGIPEPVANLPKELDNSLMSIEGHDTSATAADTQFNGTVRPDSAGATVEPEKVTSPRTTPVHPGSTKPVSVQDSVSASSALPSRTPTRSIDDNSSEDVTSSIFDTPDHDALKHPAKHSTGWYAVVILAGMAIIGVLGGVLFYFMTSGS